MPQGKLHHEKEPSFILSDGSKYWYMNGKPHREDGPAVEYSNGNVGYWLNGKTYSKKEYGIKMRKIKLERLRDEDIL